ncbi:MAG TPA: hypothetical protein VG838_08645 [Opitutaceae bacterium]|nr:hypothetical protein [Opitutaceae bacterium]
MPIEAKKKDSPYTMYMGRPQREKLQRMQGYCIANGIQISSGGILRTLLEHVPEQSADFLAKVKVQAAREKEEKQEKFQASTGGKKRGKRRKT